MTKKITGNLAPHSYMVQPDVDPKSIKTASDTPTMDQSVEALGRFDAWQKALDKLPTRPNAYTATRNSEQNPLTAHLASAVVGAGMELGHRLNFLNTAGIMGLDKITDDEWAAYQRVEAAQNAGTTYEGMDADLGLLNTYKPKESLGSQSGIDSEYKAKSNQLMHAYATGDMGKFAHGKLDYGTAQVETITPHQRIKSGLQDVKDSARITKLFDATGLRDSANQDYMNNVIRNMSESGSLRLDEAEDLFREGKTLDAWAKVFDSVSEVVANAPQLWEADGSKVLGYINELIGELGGQVGVGMSMTALAAKAAKGVKGGRAGAAALAAGVAGQALSAYGYMGAEGGRAFTEMWKDAKESGKPISQEKLKRANTRLKLMGAANFASDTLLDSLFVAGKRASKGRSRTGDTTSDEALQNLVNKRTAELDAATATPNKIYTQEIAADRLAEATKYKKNYDTAGRKGNTPDFAGAKATDIQDALDAAKSLENAVGTARTKLDGDATHASEIDDIVNNSLDTQSAIQSAWKSLPDGPMKDNILTSFKDRNALSADAVNAVQEVAELSTKLKSASARLDKAKADGLPSEKIATLTKAKEHLELSLYGARQNANSIKKRVADTDERIKTAIDDFTGPMGGKKVDMADAPSQQIRDKAFGDMSRADKLDHLRRKYERQGLPAHEIRAKLREARKEFGPVPKKDLLASAAKSVGKTALYSGAEGITEGTQTVLEDSLYKDSLDMRNAYVGAFAGLLGTAGVRTQIGALKEASNIAKGNDNITGVALRGAASGAGAILKGAGKVAGGLGSIVAEHMNSMRTTEPEPYGSQPSEDDLQNAYSRRNELLRKNLTAQQTAAESRVAAAQADLQRYTAAGDEAKAKAAEDRLNAAQAEVDSARNSLEALTEEEAKAKREAKAQPQQEQSQEQEVAQDTVIDTQPTPTTDFTGANEESLNELTASTDKLQSIDESLATATDEDADITAADKGAVQSANSLRESLRQGWNNLPSDADRDGLLRDVSNYQNTTAELVAARKRERELTKQIEEATINDAPLDDIDNLNQELDDTTVKAETLNERLNTEFANVKDIIAKAAQGKFTPESEVTAETPPTTEPTAEPSPMDDVVPSAVAGSPLPESSSTEADIGKAVADGNVDSLLDVASPSFDLNTAKQTMDSLAATGPNKSGTAKPISSRVYKKLVAHLASEVEKNTDRKRGKQLTEMTKQLHTLKNYVGELQDDSTAVATHTATANQAVNALTHAISASRGKKGKKGKGKSVDTARMSSLVNGYLDNVTNKLDNLHQLSSSELAANSAEISTVLTQLQQLQKQKQVRNDDVLSGYLNHTIASAKLVAASIRAEGRLRTAESDMGFIKSFDAQHLPSQDGYDAIQGYLNAIVAGGTVEYPNAKEAGVVALLGKVVSVLPKNSIHRHLLKGYIGKLTTAGTDIPLIVSDVHDEGNKLHAGRVRFKAAFNPKSTKTKALEVDNIIIYLRDKQGKPRTAEQVVRTLMHEVIHAPTYRALSVPASDVHHLTAADQKFRKEMGVVHEAIKAFNANDVDAAIHDKWVEMQAHLFEVPTYGLSDTRIIQQLQRITVTGEPIDTSKATSVWAKLINAVTTFLTGKPAGSRAISAYEYLVKSYATYQQTLANGDLGFATSMPYNSSSNPFDALNAANRLLNDTKGNFGNFGAYPINKLGVYVNTSKRGQTNYAAADGSRYTPTVGDVVTVVTYSNPTGKSLQATNNTQYLVLGQETDPNSGKAVYKVMDTNPSTGELQVRTLSADEQQSLVAPDGQAVQVTNQLPSPEAVRAQVEYFASFPTVELQGVNGETVTYIYDGATGSMMAYFHTSNKLLNISNAPLSANEHNLNPEQELESGLATAAREYFALNDVMSKLRKQGVVVNSELGNDMATSGAHNIADTMDLMQKVNGADVDVANGLYVDADLLADILDELSYVPDATSVATRRPFIASQTNIQPALNRLFNILRYINNTLSNDDRINVLAVSRNVKEIKRQASNLQVISEFYFDRDALTNMTDTSSRELRETETLLESIQSGVSPQVVPQQSRQNVIDILENSKSVLLARIAELQDYQTGKTTTLPDWYVHNFTLTQELLSAPQPNGQFDYKYGNRLTKWFQASPRSSLISRIPGIVTKLSSEQGRNELFGKELAATNAVTEANTRLLEFYDLFAAAFSKLGFQPPIEQSTNRELLGESLMYTLRDRDGNYPEGVVLTMAISAIEWLTTSGTASKNVTENSINHAIDREADSPVPEILMQKFNGKASLKGDLVYTLGRNVVETMGFEAQDSAPMHARQALCLAVGTAIYDTLMDMGVLEEGDGPSLHEAYTDIKNAMGIGAVPRSGKKANRQKDGTINWGLLDTPEHKAKLRIVGVKPDYQDYKSLHAIKAADSTFLGRLVSTMERKPLSYLQPPVVTASKKNTATRVTPEAEAVLQDYSSRKVFIQTNTVSVLQALGEENALAVMGAPAADSIACIAESVKGKREGLARELEIIRQQNNLTGPTNTPFYLKWGPWVNDRFGIENLFDPIGSKAARALIYYENTPAQFDRGTAWDLSAPIDLTSLGSSEKFFLLAVAEQFNINSEGLHEDEAIAVFQSFLENKDNAAKIQGAFDAIAALQRRAAMPTLELLTVDAMSSAQLAPLIELTREYNKVGTLNALISFMQYMQTTEGQSFNHTLMRSKDGTNNGVYLLLNQFPDSNSEKAMRQLEQSGNSYGPESYTSKKARGAISDYYQEFITVLDERLQEQMVGGKSLDSNDRLVALASLLGEFVVEEEGVTRVTSEGRNVGKLPVLMTVYSAGIGAVMTNMGDYTLELVKQKLVAIHEMSLDHNQAVDAASQLSDLASQLSVLTNGEDSFKLQGKKPSDLLTYKLPAAATKALYETIDSVYSDPTEGTLDDQFPELAVMKEKMTGLNTIYTGLSFMIESALTKEAKAAKEAAVRARFGENAHPMQFELTVAEKRLLDAIIHSLLPHINTAASAAMPDSDSTAAGNVASKYGTPMLRYGNTAKTTDTSAAYGAGLGGTTGYVPPMSTPKLKDSGVAPIAITNQSQDAWTQYLALQVFDGALQVYDSMYMGESDWTKGHLYNATVHKVTQEFDFTQQYIHSLQSFVRRLRAFEDGRLLKLIVNSLHDATAQDAATGINAHGYTHSEFKRNAALILGKRTSTASNIMLTEDERLTDFVQTMQAIEANFTNKRDQYRNTKKVLAKNLRSVNQFANGNTPFILTNNPAYLREMYDFNPQLVEQHPYIKSAVDKVMGTSQEQQQEQEPVILSEIHDSIYGDVRKQSGKPDINAMRQSNPKPKTAYDKVIDVNKTTSIQVFDQLGSIGTVQSSPAHAANLRLLLQRTVGKLITPMKLHLAEGAGTNEFANIRGDDVYIVNEMDGAAHEQSNLLAVGMRMSAQEKYAHAMVFSVAKQAIKQSVGFRRAALTLYERAMDSIDHTAFIDENIAEGDDTYPEAVKAAKEVYDSIFKAKKANVDSITPLLPAFMALAATNEHFGKLLSRVPASTRNKGRGIIGTVSDVISRLYHTMVSKVSNVYVNPHTSESVREELRSLTKELAMLDASNRTMLYNARSKLHDVSAPVLNTTTKILKAVPPMAQSASIKLLSKKSTTARAVGAALNEAVEGFPTIKRYSEKAWNDILSVDKGYKVAIRKVVTEMSGTTERNAAYHRLKREGSFVIDRYRHRQRSQLKATLQELFKNTDKKTREALTTGIVQTDLHRLLTDDNSMYAIPRDTLMEALRDPTKLKDIAINVEQSFTTDVTTNPYYTLQAKGLGVLMATGVPGNELQVTNVGSIVDGVGILNKTIHSAEARKNAEILLGQLASLHALMYSPKGTLENVAKQLDSNPDGVAFIMNAVKDSRKRTRASTSDSKVNQLVDGYVPQIWDENVGIKVATLAEETKLTRQGYIRQPKPLSQDSLDTYGEPVYVYVHPYGGTPEYLGGVLHLLSDKPEGVSLFRRLMEAADTPQDAAQQLRKEVKEITRGKLARAAVQYSHNKLTPNHKLLPVFDKDGKISNYYYMLPQELKRKLMNQDSDIFEVLPKLVSDIDAKSTIKQHNRKTLTKLQQDAAVGYAKHPEHYAILEAESTNPEWAKMYHKLPDDIKESTDKLYIRKDDLDLIVGYTKFRLSDLLMMDKKDRSTMQKIVTAPLEHIFGRKAIERVRQTGDIWGSIVRLAKDVIVIRSALVTVVNTLSNATLLLAKGMNPIDIVTHMYDASRQLSHYKAVEKKIDALETSLKFANNDLATQERIVNKINVLRSSLVNLKIAPLIEGGALSSIVEDIDMTTGTFGKDALSKQLNKLSLYRKARASKTARNLLVLDNSEAYAFLRNAAQYSDFSARYALMTHLSKTKLGMRQADVMKEVMETFIDYDLPTSRGLQYANDIGLAGFTKYVMRIQKVLYNTTMANPSRALLTFIIAGMLGIPSISEDFIPISPSSILSRFGNPLNWLGGAMDSSLHSRLLL